MYDGERKYNKRTILVLLNSLLSFFFFEGWYNPFEALKFDEAFLFILYMAGFALLVFLGYKLIKFILTLKEDDRTEKLLVRLVLAVLLINCFYILHWYDWSLSLIFEYDEWHVLSFFVQGGMAIVYFIFAYKNPYEAEKQRKEEKKRLAMERQSNNGKDVGVEDKQNNVTRFLLTFFLGWIGSLIINHSNFKPKGYKSRTMAYFFLSAITLGIYGLVASICNLSFDSTKEKNIGYFLDDTPIGCVGKEENKQIVLDNQMDQLIKLKSLFDQGIITQEEFDVKKKEILGL